MRPIINSDSRQSIESSIHQGILFLVGPNFKFCGSLIRSIESEIEGLSVAHVENLDTLLENPADLPLVRVVLIDCKLADDAAGQGEELRTLLPDAIVALSYEEGNGLPAHLMQLLNEGLFTSVVPLNLQFDRWLSAIRLMLTGEDYLPSNLLRKLAIGAANGSEHSASPHDRKQTQLSPGIRTEDLTPRQIDIMKLVAEGHQNKEIAAQLKLSEHTVKLHIHHIFTRIGAHNRTQAVKLLFG
jgi:DNA-binding NarL/FixJ family response regulator